MLRVSASNMGDYSLAYHSDYHEPGLWGYLDSTGKEIIEPQYIFAFDFDSEGEHGLARVCKGKWTIDKKWDNKYNTGKYWSETQLWGMIDKTGREVIPCIYDEIMLPWEVNEKYLRVHYGGWKEGKWGIIDYSGEWVVEPMFEDLGYETSDDYVAFLNEDKWNADEIPIGIYSINEKKVIFEPQFIDVEFLENGTFLV
jgi:hypothetical protein